MSTKIFDAYEYLGPRKELISHLKVLKKKMWKYALDELEKDPVVGQFLLEEEIPYKKIASEIQRMMLSVVHQATEPESSAVFFLTGKRTFVIFYGATRYLEKCLNPDLFVDFHYQNQTDYPEDISEKDWEKRKRIWDLLLPGFDTPRENGFIYEFVCVSDAARLTSDLVDRKRKAVK